MAQSGKAREYSSVLDNYAYSIVRWQKNAAKGRAFYSYHAELQDVRYRFRDISVAAAEVSV
jgi:hypothetical protein